MNIFFNKEEKNQDLNAKEEFFVQLPFIHYSACLFIKISY
jgi:hypothetical protein